MKDNKLEIVYRNIDDLIPYARNSRTHSEAQVNQIASSIKEFGMNAPIAIDADGGIIAGHGRVLACQKLGIKTVPTVCLSHLSETEKKAYIIADNKLALNAGWDLDLLKVELSELKDNDFDLNLTGFDDKELQNIIDGADSSITDGQYTSKIQTPQYEITGAKPALSELFDDTKTKSLLANIEKANIPDDIKHFLSLAAQRHTAFNYSNIAEYYAHSVPEIQRLFEESALVIIDFDDAIKNGYVKLKEEIAELLEQETQTDD